MAMVRGPKGSTSKPFASSSPGDGGEGDHLRRQQIEQHGHEQPLALHLLHPALAQHPLEQHPLVRHMLIDDPKPLLVHRQDEGFAQLAERPQRCQAVQRGARPGFDLDLFVFLACSGTGPAPERRSQPGRVIRETQGPAPVRSDLPDRCASPPRARREDGRAMG